MHLSDIQAQGPCTPVKSLGVLWSSQVRHMRADNVTVEILQQTVPINVKEVQARGGGSLDTGFLCPILPIT